MPVGFQLEVFTVRQRQENAEKIDSDGMLSFTFFES